MSLEVIKDISEQIVIIFVGGGSVFVADKPDEIVKLLLVV